MRLSLGSLTRLIFLISVYPTLVNLVMETFGSQIHWYFFKKCHRIMTSGFSFIMLGFLPLVLLLNSLIFCANSSYSLNKLYIFFSTIFNVIYNSTYRFTFCKIILFFLAVFLPLFRFFLRNLQFLDLALFLGIKSFNDNCSVLGFKTFKASICFFP